MTSARQEFRFSPRPNRAAEIRWRPWGTDAFAEARGLRRPVLLSLSAVWCHWCHVMDETSYSDPRVIERVNRDFVPVRVDNDRDPDVNRRYNMGGWPTTAFLTAGGEVLTGATYLPPDDMVSALERVRSFFDEHLEELTALDAQRAAERTAAAGRRTATRDAHRAAPTDRPGEPSTAPPRAPRIGAADEAAAFAGDAGAPGDLVDQVALQLVRAFDPLHGGLGTEPKFPQPEAFTFLLAYVGLRGGGEAALLAAPRLRDVLRVSLTSMAAGDVYDRVEEGFFRYATRRDWTVPHYEKMLEDNARLAVLYLDAAALAGAAAPDGGGGAGDRGRTAGDPRRSGRHGAVTSAAGARAGSEFGGAVAYRRTAAGVIAYLTATLWRDDPPVFGGSQDADERYYALDADGRSGRPAPFVDTTAYTDWNALAARALLRGAVVLKRPELSDRAVALLDHLWAHARRDGAVVHYLSPDGAQGATGGLLGDQAAVAAALLDAHEVTGRAEHLARAETLAAWVAERLTAPDGRLFDREATTAAGGLLDDPLPAIDENAAMADAWLRLEAFTGEAAYRERALALLAAWAPHAPGHGIGAAAFAAALLRALSRPDHLVVTGADDERTAALHAAALAAPSALRTVQLLDPVRDAARLAARGLPAGTAAAVGPEPADAAPAVYVCRGTSCLAPASSPEELARRLAGGA